MKQILVIVIGTISSKIALVNNYGDIQLKFYVVHDFQAGLLKNLREKVVEGLESIGIDFENSVEKIGIAVQGFIDHEIGIVRKNEDNGWENYYLKDMAEQEFKKSCHVLNNNNAKALGEFWVGNAKTIYSLIFISIGEELGGSIILDGKLLTGDRGFAGINGHGGGFPTRYECNCGLKGCSNQILSFPAIKRRFVDDINAPDSQIAMWFEEVSDPEELTVGKIVEIYLETGRPKAIKAIFDELGDCLAVKAGSLIQSLDVEAIMISCDNKDLLKILMDSMTKALPNYVNEIFLDDLAILTDKLGEDSDLIGSANFAINDWKLY
ncbi:glucokinase [Spiroplasma clarkii]|uniref:Glucokinase n=1 Tax=Spiroplasma clarkii TaxID=2139 RepID=A0A1Y0L0T9_9MOLU|nr:ROK family protein [Spiroplasma clarkii]ARU91591.1 glucokinase [Spiroplasma clarkii]ATX70992.1 glucokinase [Spiroplasma clarkii]